jgi:phosphoserine phosphatase
MPGPPCARRLALLCGTDGVGYSTPPPLAAEPDGSAALRSEAVVPLLDTPDHPQPLATVLRRFGSVVFDCDSTLSAIEGIEELAAGNRAEIERLTEAAMRGEVPLENVYARRLELIKPTRAQVSALGHRYIEAILPDARAVVMALRSAGIAVRVISGGLLDAVMPLARALGFGDDEVAAVPLKFDDSGNYLGFDTASPLARAGGKRELLERWRTMLPGPVMLVGDGATDLEAKPVVDLFVAFAGVIERAPVVAQADIVIRARSLAPILVLALGGTAPTGPAERATFDRGTALLAGRDIASTSNGRSTP